MSDQTRLEELLLLWEERHERGETVTLADLCREAPELLPELARRVAILRGFESLISPASLEVSSQAATAPPGYELLGELGRGGMGVVYRAKQLALGREVALKLIRAGFASGDSLARFQNEAESGARLAHANIVRVFEVGVHQGLPFLALELIEGIGLDCVLAARTLSPTDAARLVLALAEAIEHAHQRGVIHRDLKPSNVLLQTPSPVGPVADLDVCTTVPKVSDFGLAKQTHRNEQLTQTGMVLGTPSYMAPEQACGKVREVRQQADIYSLGAILYECLTGRAPFCSDSLMELLRQVVYDEPVPPSSVRPLIPKDIETVCCKCLEKNPTQRYESAREFADDLRRFLAGEPVVARPVSSSERAWRWMKRNPVLAFTGSAAVVALLALALVSVVYGMREARHAADLNAALKSERQSRRRETVRLAESHRENAQTLVEAVDLSAALLWLVRALETTPEGEDDLERDLRLAIRAVADQLLTPGPVFTADARVGAVALSPDGKVCAVAGKHLRLWDTQTGKALCPSLPHERVWSLTFSPDGRLLAVGGIGEAIILDRTGRPTCKPLRQPGVVQALAFSADGRELLVGSGSLTSAEGAVGLYTVADGRPRVAPFAHPGEVKSVGFGPKGELFTVGTKALHRWEQTADRWTEEVTPLPRQLTAASIAPDGQSVLCGFGDGEGRVWSLPKLGFLGLPFYHDGTIRSAVVGKVGTILTGSLDNSACLRDGASGRLEGQPLRHPDNVLSVATSADGQTIATGCEDGKARIWRLPLGPAAIATEWPVYDARPMTDGAILIWTMNRPSSKARIRLLDLKTGADRAPAWETPILLTMGNADGAVLALDAGLKIRRRNLLSGKTEPPIPCVIVAGSGTDITPHEFSPDGAKLLSVQMSADLKEFTTHFIRSDTGQSIRVPLRQSEQVRKIAFSPDGKTYATASDERGIQLWDTATGQALGKPIRPAGEVWSMAFDPTSTILAVGSGSGTAQLWWVETSQPIGPALRHGGPVESVAFSPDGKLLLTGGTRPLVRLWSVAGRPLGPPLAWAPFPVKGVGFSPDGRRILAWGAIAAAWSWQTPTPAEGDIGELRRWAETLTGLELDANGTVRFLSADSSQDTR